MDGKFGLLAHPLEVTEQGPDRTANIGGTGATGHSFQPLLVFEESLDQVNDCEAALASAPEVDPV